MRVYCKHCGWVGIDSECDHDHCPICKEYILRTCE